jgi:hypothetical protein
MYIKSTIQKETARVTVTEAIWTNKKYVKCSWINITNIIFHELTGINVVLIFSNVILATVTDPDSGFTPRAGVILIGVINFLAATGSVWTVRTFGRRILLLVGHTGIAISHFAIGLLSIYKYDYGVLAALCVFIVFYETTTG